MILILKSSRNVTEDPCDFISDFHNLASDLRNLTSDPRTFGIIVSLSQKLVNP